MNQQCLTPSCYSFNDSILAKLVSASCMLLSSVAGSILRLTVRRCTHWLAMITLALSLFTQPIVANAWTVRFSHPMTATNAAELEIVKMRIKQRKQPQYAAYLQLMQDANNALSFNPNPPAKIARDTNLDCRDVFEKSSSAVYATALAWTLTGEDVYAHKAVEIMMAWANKNTQFGINSGDHSLALDLGGWFSPMLYGADLLHSYPGWNQAERKKFESFWRNRVLFHTMAYLQGQNINTGGNNWYDSTLRDVFSAAVVFEDKALADFALTRLDKFFQSDKKFKLGKDSRGNTFTYFPAEVQRGEHPTINNGKKGVTYTAATLTRFVENIEIASYLGYDWWNRKTPGGATIKGLIETFFRWNYQRQPFPWNNNPDYLTSWRQNIFEYGNKHLDLDSAIKSWLAGHRPVSGGEGNIYATLLKGDMRGANSAAKAPSTPTGLALAQLAQ